MNASRPRAQLIVLRDALNDDVRPTPKHLPRCRPCPPVNVPFTYHPGRASRAHTHTLLNVHVESGSSQKRAAQQVMPLITSSPHPIAAPSTKASTCRALPLHFHVKQSLAGHCSAARSNCGMRIGTPHGPRSRPCGVRLLGFADARTDGGRRREPVQKVVPYYTLDKYYTRNNRATIVRNVVAQSAESSAATTLQNRKTPEKCYCIAPIQGGTPALACALVREHATGD